jgi:hypothetical protein
VPTLEAVASLPSELPVVRQLAYQQAAPLKILLRELKGFEAARVRAVAGAQARPPRAGMQMSRPPA